MIIKTLQTLLGTEAQDITPTEEWGIRYIEPAGSGGYLHDVQSLHYDPEHQLVQVTCSSAKVADFMFAALEDIGIHAVPGELGLDGAISLVDAEARMLYIFVSKTNLTKNEKPTEKTTA